jgi:hypothetical protein
MIVVDDDELTNDRHTSIYHAVNGTNNVKKKGKKQQQETKESSTSPSSSITQNVYERNNTCQIRAVQTFSPTDRPTDGQLTFPAY